MFALQSLLFESQDQSIFKLSLTNSAHNHLPYILYWAIHLSLVAYSLPFLSAVTIAFTRPRANMRSVQGPIGLGKYLIALSDWRNDFFWGGLCVFRICALSSF